MIRKLVRENMSTHLITIGWNEKMESAYRRMQTKRVKHLPVVNDTGEIIGMLSERDVQRSMISQVEKPTGRIATDETIEFDDESKVRDYMSWPAKSVEQNTELRLVAERMILEKVHSFLVCSGTRTVGIVTVEDLMKVLIELLSDPAAPMEWALDHILENPFGQLKAII